MAKTHRISSSSYARVLFPLIVLSLATLGGNCNTAAPHCVEADPDVEILTTAAGVSFVRTPDQRFDDLEGYAFPPQYVTIDGLRMHYVDTGPADGELVLLLHGDPAGSYTWRMVISGLAGQGYRVVAPDLIGMGRSDKPTNPLYHNYFRHVGWLADFVDELGLQEVTLLANGWGAALGLRLVADAPGLFARVAVANATLPDYSEVKPPGGNGRGPVSVDCELSDVDVATLNDDYAAWREYALRAPDLRASEVVEARTLVTLSPEVAAGYDAPFPSFRYKAAIRAFPSLVAGIRKGNVAAWESLMSFDKPFVTYFGTDAPFLAVGTQDELIQSVPGSEGERHQLLVGNQFLQEDTFPGLLTHFILFLILNPLDGPQMCWSPEEPASVFSCEQICDHLSGCTGADSVACQAGCNVTPAPYLHQDAGAKLQSCMLSRSCGTFTDFQSLLDGCAAQLIFTGQVQPEPGSAAVCDTLGPAVAACGAPIFSSRCRGLAFTFSLETMERMGECASASCGDMTACLLDANCTFFFADGVLP